MLTIVGAIGVFAVAVVVVCALAAWCLLAALSADGYDAVSQEWIRTHVRDDR